jgi:predicted  nucleic acid-binding Zn-ribbon protein
MEKGISEIVGRGDLDEGRSTDVYRALRALLCATCGALIAEGALFTRRKVKGIGLRIMPQCPKCAPFTLQADKKEKSALLRSLLAEPPADSSKQAGASPEVDSEAQAKAKSVDEEVRRRLGPALKRSRRGQK